MRQAWQCDDNISRVAARRVARGIGSKGFGNARSVRKAFETAVSYAKLRYAPSSGGSPHGDCRALPRNPVTAVQYNTWTNWCMSLSPRPPPLSVSSNPCLPFLLSYAVVCRYYGAAGGAIPTLIMEDVIGKEPTRASNPELDAALTELEGMVGLSSVKAELQKLVSVSERNYKHEVAGERVDEVTRARGRGGASQPLLHFGCVCACLDVITWGRGRGLCLCVCFLVCVCWCVFTCVSLCVCACVYVCGLRGATEASLCVRDASLAWASGLFAPSGDVEQAVCGQPRHGQDHGRQAVRQGAVSAAAADPRRGRVSNGERLRW